MKVIKSLKNRVVLLKGTTGKIRRFINFSRPLITVGLPLMESVATPLSNSVLIPLELSAETSAANAANEHLSTRT